MEKSKNFRLWIEEGYGLFANEGMMGLQVERLARILQLNKSGFYHYFGDLRAFTCELIGLHEKKTTLFLEEVREAKKLNPDYLLLLIKHSSMVMFQVQLTRNRDNGFLYQAGEALDQKVNLALHSLWSEYLGIEDNDDLAMRYYYIVRDMLYTRVSFQNLNLPFLHNLITDAKALVTQIVRRPPVRMELEVVDGAV